MIKNAMLGLVDARDPATEVSELRRDAVDVLGRIGHGRHQSLGFRDRPPDGGDRVVDELERGLHSVCDEPHLAQRPDHGDRDADKGQSRNRDAELNEYRHGLVLFLTRAAGNPMSFAYPWRARGARGHGSVISIPVPGGVNP